MVETDTAGGFSLDAARAYEDRMVPAMFHTWALRLTEFAAIAPGERVLDVASGTGVLARLAIERAGSGGVVCAIDADAAMCEIAKDRSPGVAVSLGTAEQLPYGPEAFDAVLCQFGLMFFSDRAAAVTEMRRVLAPGGRVVASVWGRFDDVPAFVALAGLLDELHGSGAGAPLRTPFTLADPLALEALFAGVGFAHVEVSLEVREARFGSLPEWVESEARGWLQLDEAQLDSLQAAAASVLAEHVDPSGEMIIPMPAFVVHARD